MAMGEAMFDSRNEDPPAPAEPLLRSDEIGDAIPRQRLLSEIARHTAIEEALRRSEERARLAIEATNLGTWDWDVRGGGIVWNERTYELWEVTRGRSIDYDLVRRGVHPDDRDRFDAVVSGALSPSGDGSLHAEFRVIGVDRPADRWIEAQARAAFEGGVPVRLIGSVLDVTARRRAEEALGESQRQLGIALETGVLGTWSRNIETGETTWDARTAALLGARSDERVDFDAFMRRVHPDDRDRVRDAVRQALERGNGGRYHAEFRLAEAPDRWLETHSLIVRDERGTRLVGTLRDATERKEREQRLRRLVDEARSAVQVRDEFLAVAAHELRTPLTALLLHVDRLTRVVAKHPPATDLPAAVGNAKKQVLRLVRLVDGLFDATRISAGRLTLDRSELDLAALARETIERMRPDGARVGCAVSLRAPEPVVGTWDPMRLEQVLANLLGNAFRYAAGKPVDVTVEATADRATLRVRDLGVGIAKKDQPRVFDRFERATSLRHHGGLGLGLFITRQIVEAHGGTIALESAPGEGATFTVTLPRSAPG